MIRPLCNAIISGKEIQGNWGCGGPAAGYPLSNFEGNEFILCQGQSLTLWSQLAEDGSILGTTFYPCRMGDFICDLQKETRMTLTAILKTHNIIIYRLHKPDEKIANPFTAQ